MPHVVVKMYTGRTEAQKAALADAITQAVITTLGSKSSAVWVGIEDVDPADWDERVKGPDIEGKAHTLWKKPGT